MKFLTLLLIFTIAVITGSNLMNPSKNKDDSKNKTYESTQRLSYESDSSIINETAKISGDTDRLATYSTQILTSDPNRYNNIKIVADRLNGFVLEPGKEFSFNNELGPYGKDDGFLEAKILLSNGEESEGYGGGVCQLSTTLYNAVKELDKIEITEHHNHSTPVAYAPKNQDATVSLQSGLDFKFKNNYDFPIRFETAYNPNNLTVTVHKSAADTGDVR